MRAALVALAGTGTLVLAGAFAALQAEPAVVLHGQPEAEDVARALALVRAHAPQRAVPGAVSGLHLDQRDVELLANHAGWRGPQAATRITLQRQAATVHSSLHLPPNPFGRWLNVQVHLRETAGLPVLDGAQVGALPVPRWLAQRVAAHLAARAGIATELQTLSQVLRRVHFTPQGLDVVVAWQPDSAARVAGLLLPADEQHRLQAYTALVATWASARPAGATVSLASLVGPVFTLAAQRSQGADDAAAGAENRAAIAVLALYVNGLGVDQVLPAASAWPRPQPLQVTLGGRDDFPRHLLVSATLAAESTGPLSRAIGIYKEVADARGGTGFSFNDMAANRAGTRLGELALSAPHRLQAMLARGVDEADFMPAWQDLPESMAEPEFKRRYGGVDAPAYAAMVAEIDRRVAALPALR